MIFLSNQSILEYVHVCEKEKEGVFPAALSQIRPLSRQPKDTAMLCYLAGARYNEAFLLTYSYSKNTCMSDNNE